MIVLENELREMFAARVEGAPAVHDPATAVIGRARRARRGRVAAGGTAAALTLAGLFGGVVSLQGWWAPEPTVNNAVISPILPPPEPATEISGTDDEPLPWRGNRHGLELRLVNRIWAADGERPLLRGTALVEQAYRTPYGLLYGSPAEIRLAGSDEVVGLATDAGRWLPSPDGRQVAFISGGALHVARLDTDGLGTPARADVPAGTTPVIFWGERVVLAGPEPGTYDLWDPAGPYRPAWTDQLAAVYGQAGDDLVVLVGEPGAHCLARVPAGADELRPDRGGGCDRPVPVGPDGYGWLAPGGGWLALPDGDQVHLLPTSPPQGDDVATVTCPRHEPVTPMWWDATTLLTADESGVVTCNVAGEKERLGRPDGLGPEWDYVPALGVSTVPVTSQTPR